MANTTQGAAVWLVVWLAIAVVAGQQSASVVVPRALRVNYLANSTSTSNPLRVQAVEPDRLPDFSWQLQASPGLPPHAATPHST